MLTAHRISASWVSIPTIGKRLIKFTSNSQKECQRTANDLSGFHHATHQVIKIESQDSFDTYAVVRLTRRDIRQFLKGEK